MDLDAGLKARLGPGTAEPVTLGESGAGVWRWTTDSAASHYLKAAKIAAGHKLSAEADRLRWMKNNGLLVPAVEDYGRVADVEYLLLEEIAGVPASDAGFASHLPELATALGNALALLHQTSIVKCPFDQRLAGQIEEARRRIAAGNVREDDFDEIRVGRPPSDLLDELIALIPDSEDLVFTHGDFCLPNIILQPSLQEGFRLGGFVDCGRAGIADRHQDLALAVRSVSRNFGEEWIEPMLGAYRLARPNPEKLFFYTLLDEFF